jgi:hypothetical protein
MIRKLSIPILLLVLSTACSPVPVSTPTVAVPPPALTIDMLRNATYLAPNSGKTVTLVDGAYASGSDPSAVDFLQVTLSEPVAFGDLNYDGRQDAAVLLAENMGGTGVFVALIAVLDDGGAPRQVASVFIDDRPLINMLVIQSGEILLDAVLHGADDPMCCPEQQSQRGYRLYTDQLVLTRLSDETTTGIMRSIDITSPIDLEEKEYPVAVSGSVTIGPFESTLAYNIYDPANILVTAGSVMTDSPDMGLPGNFSLSVDLTMAGVTGLVRIEFVEYSMADGSVLTLDSVLVRVP